MANLTYYVVLAFIHDADGELIAEEAMEAPNEHAAISRARSIADRKAGAIAFRRTGDRDLGEFADAVILGRYGETPVDLAGFTSME